MTTNREALTLERVRATIDLLKRCVLTPDDSQRIYELLCAVEKDLSRAAEPVNTTSCPECGAPCRRTVHMRGGDWGWSTTDEERAEYEYTHPPEPARDAKLLNMFASECWKLEPFDIPTGAGDADVGWRVTKFYESAPKERVVAEVYENDPRAALSAAMAQESGE